jgi:protoporphyrinogen oxidase
MTLDTDTFIIGAGPAGLTAAYCLSKQTPSVLVVEKDPDYVGGLSRTVRHKNFLFDIGGHRFFSRSKEIIDLWEEILPNDFITQKRLSRILYDGKYYSYPLRPFEALSNLGLLRSAACILSYLYAKTFPVADPRTFHDWVRNQFGETLYLTFFKTYTEKVWGLPCDEISADWAAQRIKDLDLGTAVLHGVQRMIIPRRKASNPPAAKSLIEEFRYPRLGPGMMWEAATRKIRQRGAKVLLGHEVRSLAFDQTDRIWRIGVATINRTHKTYTARHVICSASMRELMEMIAPQPRSLLEAQRLRYRDFLVVALVVNKLDLFPDNWIYVHDQSVRVARVQNFRSWSEDMVPPGMSCLGLEYFCFQGDDLWSAEDHELAALAAHEMSEIGLINPADVIDACIVRQPKAYPIYDYGYQNAIKAIRQELEANYPTLHLVGRNGMHRYNNQDHAMMTGMLTARNISAGQRLYDPWKVNEDAEYHETVSAVRTWTDRVELKG